MNNRGLLEIHFIISIFLVVMLKGASASAADYEAAVFYVDKYGKNSDDLCCDECSSLDNPETYAATVANVLDGMGYDQVEFNDNSSVDGKDWTDSGSYNWGRDEVDPQGTDFADVVFYAGHGGHHCDSYGYYSSIVMGDFDTSDSRCWANTTTNMVFGDSGGDANILLFASCRTAQYCVWDHGGYSRMLNGNANIMNGFHGEGTDSLYAAAKYTEYVSDAETSGLGDDWVDLLSGSGISRDICATSVIYGSSRANRDNQYNNGGFMDFIGTGSHTGSTIYYMCNCDPDDGEELPDC
jgi:hypothetical protein